MIKKQLIKTLGFRVTSEFYNKIKKEADRFHKSISVYLRDMLYFLVYEDLHPAPIIELSELHPPRLPPHLNNVRVIDEWKEASQRKSSKSLIRPNGRLHARM
jgi:hypothetical protein